MPRIIATTVYELSEHPDPEKVFYWLRNNWHDLGEHVLQETVDSLKAFASHLGAKVDYSLSIVPCRGEHIRFNFGDDDLPELVDICIELDLSGNCPFTGVCTDEVILDAFRDAAENATANTKDTLQDVEYRVLKALHAEGEHLYSDEGLRDMCDANEYEFNAKGEYI